MLRAAVVCFVVSLFLALLGFLVLAAGAAELARIGAGILLLIATMTFMSDRRARI
jgi:uncharacterized membrane protein YtjA (UPF0391 family)